MGSTCSESYMPSQNDQYHIVILKLLCYAKIGQTEGECDHVKDSCSVDAF